MNGPVYQLNRTVNSHKTNLSLFQDVLTSMLSCYGPFGGNTILDPMVEIDYTGERKFDDARVTRDGVSIFLKLKDSPDGLLSPFLSTLKTVSAKNDVKGGDGTTSSVLFTLFMYNFCAREKFKPSVEAINLIQETMNKYMYVPSTPEELLNAAKVSLNNDEELAEPLRKIFKAMETEGLDWKAMDIIPVRGEALDEDAVKVVVSNAVSTYNFPVFRKKVDMDRTPALNLHHALGSPADVAQMVGMIRHFVDTLVKAGKKSLLVCAPSISVNVIEHLAPYVQQMKEKVGFDLEFIELFNPLNDTGEGSEDLAVAACLPTVNTYEPIIIDGKGTKTVIDMTKANLSTLYVAYIMKQMPEVSLTVFGDHTKIRLDAVNNNLLEIRERRIAAVEEEVKYTAAGVTRSRLENRLRGLKQESALLYVNAPTEEGKRMLYDQYKDACLQMKHAKAGIIAAGNMGIARIVYTTIKENKEYLETKVSVKKTLELIHEVAVELMNQLLILKKDYMKSIGETYNFGMERDIMDNMARTTLDDKIVADATKGHNILLNESSKDIVVSAYTEMNIVKSAVDLTGMWMGSNQIIWGSYDAARRYDSLLQALTEA